MNSPNVETKIGKTQMEVSKNWSYGFGLFGQVLLIDVDLCLLSKVSNFLETGGNFVLNCIRLFLLTEHQSIKVGRLRGNFELNSILSF